jgi:hypothetical protein
LSLAVLEDLEIFRAKVWYDLPLFVRHRHINLNEIGRDLYDLTVVLRWVLRVCDRDERDKGKDCQMGFLHHFL